MAEADIVTMPSVEKNAAWRSALGWILLTNPGSFTMVLGPVFAIAFVSAMGVTAAQAAALGAVELAGMALATLAIGFLPLGRGARERPERASTVAVAAALAGQCLTLFVHGFAGLAAVRLVVGAGTGSAFTLAIAALAKSDNPDRQFGLQMATNQLSIFLLMNLSAFMGGSGEAITPLYFIAGATALSLFATLFLPARPKEEAVRLNAAASTAGAPKFAAIGAIVTCLLFNSGVGAFWPLVGQVAQAAGQSSAAVSNALAWAPLAAIAGGVAAAAAGSALPRLPLILVGNGVMAAVMVMMGRPGGAALFLAYVSLFMFLWLVMMPYYFGMLAALDPSGRLASLSGLLLSAGMATGQGLSTAWLNFEGVGSLWLIGVGHLLLSSILALVTGRALRQA